MVFRSGFTVNWNLMLTRRRIFLIFFTSALVFAGWWTTFARPIVFCAFLQSDSIDAAYCGTYDRLKNYREQPDAAIDWLLASHGAAPSQQVMYDVVAWSYDNPEDFLDLLARLDQGDWGVLAPRIFFAITDTRQSENFRNAFSSRSHESERLREILDRLKSTT